jgi:hypothetical protein
MPSLGGVVIFRCRIGMLSAAMSMLGFGQFFRTLAEKRTRCVALTAPALPHGRLIPPAEGLLFSAGFLGSAV